MLPAFHERSPIGAQEKKTIDVTVPVIHKTGINNPDTAMIVNIANLTMIPPLSPSVPVLAMAHQ
jgi:hypothetical protein